MKFSDYIQNISFNFMGPQNYFKGFSMINGGLNYLGLSLEVINTYLPENRKTMARNLKALLKLPRMSTFAIGAIINKGVSEMNRAKCYLNVGVWHGFSYFSGIMNNQMKTCIGVDDFFQFGGPKDEFHKRYLALRAPAHQFYKADYMSYFKEMHTGEIGFYTYDGEHDYANQLQGLRLAEPFFSEDCIILIDDTNAAEPRGATMDFMRESQHRYQILLDVQTLFNRHPTFWNGLMVLKRESATG